MNPKVPVVLLIVVAAALAIGFIVTDGGQDGPDVPPTEPDLPPVEPEVPPVTPDPDIPPSEPDVSPDEPEVPPEVPDEDVLPEGYLFDAPSGTLSYREPTDWHVFDEYHAYMNADRSVYTGHDVLSEEYILLPPGKYTVTSNGNEMSVEVPGDVSRTMSWTFDMDGVKHRVSLDFAIPMELYGPQSSDSSEFNKRFDVKRLMFYELPKQVCVDEVIRDIESKLASEYVRIGGHTEDRQGYADFIASAVQLTIAYPPWIDYQTDQFIWGVPEYWGAPLETLYHMTGDCDDTAILLCALYEAAGYISAVGGHAGHVFAGVHLDAFEETSRERLDSLGVGKHMKPSSSYGVGTITADGRDAELSDVLFYSVETIYDQIPVGYLGGGNEHLDQYTFWGWAGFYTKDTKVV